MVLFYGIYIGSEYYVDEFSFSLAFISWIITLISGMTFLGFAEIIKLLEAIKTNNYTNNQMTVYSCYIINVIFYILFPYTKSGRFRPLKSL